MRAAWSQIGPFEYEKIPLFLILRTADPMLAKNLSSVGKLAVEIPIKERWSSNMDELNR